jgi:hypothetical protein
MDWKSQLWDTREHCFTMGIWKKAFSQKPKSCLTQPSTVITRWAQIGLLFKSISCNIINYDFHIQIDKMKEFFLTILDIKKMTIKWCAFESRNKCHSNWYRILMFLQKYKVKSRTFHLECNSVVTFCINKIFCYCKCFL